MWARSTDSAPWTLHTRSESVRIIKHLKERNQLSATIKLSHATQCREIDTRGREGGKLGIHRILRELFGRWAHPRSPLRARSTALCHSIRSSSSSWSSGSSFAVESSVGMAAPFATSSGSSRKGWGNPGL